MSLPPKDTETTRSSLDLLYHISRELASALDLRAVLERMLFLSLRNTGAISGSIIVLDDSGRAVESAIVTGEQVMKDTTQQLRVTLDRGLAGWVVRNRKPALLIDTSQDERWMQRQYDLDERTDPKSAVSAPLLVRGERLVGVMTLVHPKAGFFNEEHLNLVQAIADQASIAVLNARLYVESQRQARVMTALAETAATITGSLNLEDVLLRIMEQTSQALMVQAVSLALLEPGATHLLVRAAIGWANKNIYRTKIRLGQSIAGWVANEGRGTIVNDVNKDSRFDPETDQRTGLKTRAIACAPLRYRGQVIGVLEAINPHQENFDPDALLVLSGIGSLAGTAVRHAQLFERLQAAHQSYRELFEDSIDPILITEWSGKIMEANRQGVVISEYDKDTLCAMNISQIHTLDEDLLGVNFDKLISGDTLSYESRLRSRSGHEIPIQAHVRQVVIEGTPHIQWILRDITERKNLDSMREDLLSMIYHDLRSPLSNVISSLDVLDTILVEDDQVHSLLQIAQRSTDRIQRLTNSLLDINRLEAGQPAGARQPNDPISMIEEAVQVARPLVENKQQSLSTDLPVSLPLVWVDGEMIRRVITNLVENANKYSPVGSKIEAGAKQVDEDWVQIWVQDNGPGIPASEQERIFQKFTRLTSREKQKGLGLGLAYCKLAINGHGGKIWVESEPGNGSRFIFTIPTKETN